MYVFIQLCDVCLYTITPKMTGVYSIAEAVDDSNKKPHDTVLVLLEHDDIFTFSSSKWMSLEAVAKMVSSNGSKVFYTLDSVADYLNKR
jgi:hypothetical protein